MPAVIYTRVSTDDQVQSGAGLLAQQDACATFAQQQGWTVAGVYSDEGVSGTADLEKRVGLMNAISALGKGDVLVVAKRDRLGRDVVLVKMIERLVGKRKATIHALNGSNDATPEGQFMNGILDLSSAYEVALIRARTRAAMNAKKVRNERVGKLPWGFRLAADKIHLEACPNEQAILQRINELRQAGSSLRKVADALNKEGIVNRQGLRWNHVSLHTICKDLDQRLVEKPQWRELTFKSPA